MANLEQFDGHLRRIAEAAVRWTPGLVGIECVEREGRRIVRVDMGTATTRLWGRLFVTMETFCRKEGIPPDYSFRYSAPLPKGFLPPPRPSPADLPEAWPPTPERAEGR